MDTISITFAALMHDIGKFMQRAHSHNQGLSESTTKMIGYICPSGTAGYSHFHSAYTYEFLHSLDWLPTHFERNEIADVSSFHHRPDTDSSELISRADSLSAGMDRDELTRVIDPQTGFRDRRLVSVASRICGFTPQKQAFVELDSLSRKSLFPVSYESEYFQNGQILYKSLWDRFVAEWQTNRCKDPVGFINRVLSILEKYTSCIPSATNVFPDISLYDHARTTAAIAACINYPDNDKKLPFLLVSGDLPGIQSYLFGFKMGAGSLAGRLRARSFNVASICDAVSLGILKALGLSLCNRIQFAGGKFVLLLPNTPDTISFLESYRQTLTKKLLHDFGGQVSIALAYLPCSSDDIKKSCSDILSKLHVLLRDERDMFARAVLQNNGKWDQEQFLLEYPQVGLQTCASCDEKQGKMRRVRDTEKPICDSCWNDAIRGKRLPKTRYAVIRPLDNESDEYIDLIDALASCQLSDGLILDMDDFSTERPDLPIVFAPRARHIPRSPDGDALTFEEIASYSTGVNRLGYLKMDIDNLGSIFREFTSKDANPSTKPSLSRYAGLSRSLELFFSWHIQELLESRFDKVYLVYSGGDDLLAIGPWDVMFDLAVVIRHDFARYTGANPAWSISAGIAVCNPNIPVLISVEHAEAMLEFSKSAVGKQVLPYFGAHQDASEGEPSKNRVTAFSTSMQWHDFEQALNEGKQLHQWLKSEIVSSGKVRRLLSYSEMHRQFITTRSTQYLSFVPLLVRDLRRNWKEDTPEQKNAKLWASRLTQLENPSVHTLRFACEYAFSATRQPSDKE